MRDRGLDAQAIGAVLALLAAVGFAAGLLWGYLADRAIGRERTFALCLVGTVAGPAWFFVAAAILTALSALVAFAAAAPLAAVEQA